MGSCAASARETTEVVARRSYGRLVKLLARRTRDFPGAEDALSSAFVAALVDWPERGVPGNPEAWLLTAARRKWIDSVRRSRHADEAAGHLRLVAEQDAAASEPSDDPSALAFVCAHPAIDPELRVPLVLQILLGFDAAAIGSAFQVSPVGMGQRLVRAKQKIRRAGRSFEPPDAAELEDRLDDLREAVQAAFAQVRSASGQAAVVRAGHDHPPHGEDGEEA